MPKHISQHKTMCIFDVQKLFGNENIYFTRLGNTYLTAVEKDQFATEKEEKKT